MFSTNLYLSLLLAFFVAQSLSYVVSVRPVGDTVPKTTVFPPLGLPPYRTPLPGISPHTTTSETFYLTTSYEFANNASIYNQQGEVAYIVSPYDAINGIIFSEPEKPKHATIIQLDDCTQGAYPLYWFNTSSEQWQVVHGKEKPNTSLIFKSTSEQYPTGTIESPFYGYVAAQITVVDEVPKGSKIPGGSYYSVFISADSGFSPYVTSDHALTLLFLLLNHGKHCANFKA